MSDKTLREYAVWMGWAGEIRQRFVMATSEKTAKLTANRAYVPEVCVKVKLKAHLENQHG